jgi:hypothetical protein
MSVDGLTTFLRSLEVPHSISFQSDDLASWPQELVRALTDAGLLSEGSYATHVTCDGCELGCVEEVVLVDRGDDAAPEAYVICHEREDVGRIRVSLDRLRTRRVSFPGLASWLATELGAADAPEELLPERLWWLGRPMVNGCRADTFLGRGPRWSGAKNTFGSDERLRDSVAPLVLVPDRVGPKSVFGESAVVASLARSLRFGRMLTLDCSAIHFGDVTQLTASSEVFHHAPDFRSVCLRGREFSLTTNQAKVVECLYQARMNKTPDVGQGYLLETVLDTNQARLRDVFRDVPDWDMLIVLGKTKGTFRLNF